MNKISKINTKKIFLEAKKVYRMFLNNKKIYDQFLNDKINYNIENIEKTLNAEPTPEKHKTFIKFNVGRLTFETIKESYQKQLTNNLKAILITFKDTETKALYLIKEV